MAFETANVLEGYRQGCEDRFAIIDGGGAQNPRTIVVVADGAGGTGSGAEAAETVISEVRNHHQQIDTAEGWSQLLTQTDFRIATGQATAVVVDLQLDRIIGASVGDSEAWMIDGVVIDKLTSGQTRKPLLGSGASRPVAFKRGSLSGTLVVGSDGLFNHAKREQLTKTVACHDFLTIPRRCLELVRLPSGELWDDTCVVTCRNRPVRRSRKRYVL